MPPSHSHATRKPCVRQSPLAPWLIALFALVIQLLGASAEARVFVLRPDGTGDVPTFQAGMDSLLGAVTRDSPDTLLVMPGLYEEDVVVEPTGSFDGVIHCPGGPEATELRSLLGFDQPSEAYQRHLTVGGLRVRGSFVFGLYPPRLRVIGCLFLGDVAMSRLHGSSEEGDIVDCEFRGRLDLSGAPFGIRGCRFAGRTARLGLWTDFPMRVEDCVFEGGADTAVVTSTIPTDGIYFSRCSFRDVGIGIAVSFHVWPGFTSSYLAIDLADCLFENIAGAAVRVLPRDDLWVRNARLGICGTRFENCGSAIDGRSGPPLRLDMSQDTLIACRGPGIDANIATVRMESDVIRGSGADGAVLRLAELEWSSGGSTISGCLFESNTEDGLSVVDAPAIEGGLVIRGNTSVLNGGAGIRLVPSAAPSVATVAIENNLVAGNAGAGLIVESPYAGTIQHNDAWMNAGGDYVGVLDPRANLTLDPQFCDPFAGDFHVSASSPCAPSGPFGQIGALGVGCETIAALVDVRPDSRNPINLGSNAPIEAAILGHRLFDASRVDPATVRLAGASPYSRGFGRTVPHLEDVNRDGIPDLLLAFDTRTLVLDGDELTLEGQSLDGAQFRGTDVVEAGLIVKRNSNDQQNGSGELALAAPSPQREASLMVFASLPQPIPSTLEVFDVSGRRMLSQEIPPDHASRRTIRLEESGGFPGGVYLVRLSQAGSTAKTRVVLIR